MPQSRLTRRAERRTGLHVLAGCWRGAVPRLLGIAAACTRSDPSAVGPGKVGELIRISGATPFPVTCATQLPFQWNAEVEPHLAVNPLNSRNLVVAWRQDLYDSGGGARGLVTAASYDGGSTWHQTVPPGLSLCTGGEFDRATYPWVAFGADGAAHLNSIGFSNTEALFPGEDTLLWDPNTLGINSSMDGGGEWSRPFVFPHGAEEQLERDARPTIVAHPTDADRIYAVWSAQTWGRGPYAFFSKTTDHGATWSTPALIASNAPLTAVYNRLLVLGDGALLDVSTDLTTYVATRSEDEGLTWGVPAAIGYSTSQFKPSDSYSADSNGPYVDTLPAPQAAIGPDGTVYVTWPEFDDSLGTGLGALRVAWSEDGGRRWSPTVSVDAVHPFLPAPAVTRSGIIGIAFYDLRNDGPDGFTADLWFAVSSDRGASWTTMHIAGPIDLLSLPKRDGAAFLGEYIGAVALDDRTFGVAFVMPPPQAMVGPSDIFFTRIEVPQ